MTTLDKATSQAQFYLLLDGLMGRVEEPPYVRVYLASGHALDGYVLGLTGTVVFTLAESQNNYFPQTVIAFHNVVAIEVGND